MKSASLLLSVLVLSACTSVSLNGQTIQTKTESVAITAFRDVCLRTAPSFAGAQSAAQHFGILGLRDLEGAKTGLSVDKSLSVRVKANQECAVVTEKQRDITLTGQFIKAVSGFATVAPAGVPAMVDIKGQAYLVTHDRKGGETFVMTKAPKQAK